VRAHQGGCLALSHLRKGVFAQRGVPWGLRVRGLGKPKGDVPQNVGKGGQHDHMGSGDNPSPPNGRRVHEVRIRKNPYTRYFDDSNPNGWRNIFAGEPMKALAPDVEDMAARHSLVKRGVLNRTQEYPVVLPSWLRFVRGLDIFGCSFRGYKKGTNMPMPVLVHGY